MTLALLAACHSAETDDTDAAGPTWHALVSLERWHRSDPVAEHTMTGIRLDHLDDREPAWVQVDERCGYHLSDWTNVDEPVPSFGTIRMQGTDVGEVVWESGERGPGWEDPTGALVWDTGSTLKVTADGADLPGFELEDTVPAQAVLTSHDFASLHANEMVLSRTEPLALTWQPAGSDVMLLMLQGDSAFSSFGVGLVCTFPGADGAASIPADVLSHLLPSTDPAAALTNIYFGGASRKDLELDDVDLTMITWKGEVARIQVR